MRPGPHPRGAWCSSHRRSSRVRADIGVMRTLGWALLHRPCQQGAKCASVFLLETPLGVGGREGPGEGRAEQALSEANIALLRLQKPAHRLGQEPRRLNSASGVRLRAQGLDLVLGGAEPGGVGA